MQILRQKITREHLKAISFSGDVYDWDYHKKSPMRNSLIFLERLRTGLDDNHGFKVCIYGTAKLNQTWPY